jgi:hypothetical protein
MRIAYHDSPALSVHKDTQWDDLKGICIAYIGCSEPQQSIASYFQLLQPAFANPCDAAVPAPLLDAPARFLLASSKSRPDIVR